MFKYFNCFFSSFFRTLGRIIVYILLGLVFSTILSKIDVHARTILGDIEIGDWSSFTNGAFYNIVSTDSIQNKGWVVNSSGIAGATSSFQTIYNSYGMGISICDLSLLADNYYSISLMIGSYSDAYYHPFYVNRSTKLGISNNSSVWFTNFNYDNLSDGVQQNYISLGLSQFIYLNSFTGIFKAPASGTCLNLAFSSNKTVDFYLQSSAIGYRLTSLGSKPLTEQQISNALSQDFQNLNNSINNLSSGINTANGKLDDINGSLNNSDTTDATNDANNFFNNFTTDTHGLTGIITAPLNAINSLTNKTCSPLILPLPFVDKDLTLPCMRSIYDEHFGSFMTLYDTITFGIVSYWVCVRIFSFVKDFKNPEHDEIEVVDL